MQICKSQANQLMIQKKKHKNKNITYLCFSYPHLACSLLLCYSFAISLLILVIFIRIKIVLDSFVVFAAKTSKMSLAETLHSMLAFMPTNQVLAKDIQLEVLVQEG